MQASEAMGKHTTIGMGRHRRQRIEPLFNEMFIRIFGSDRSYNLTKSLVNSIFEKVGLEPIETIYSLDAEHAIVDGSIDCKTPRLDVQIVASGQVIDLEAQNKNDAIGDRFLFYGTKLIAKHAKSGTRYADMPKVIVITLLDNVSILDDSEDFVSIAKMRWGNESGDVASDKLTFVLVELDKFRRQYDMLDKEVLSDPTLAWLYLLTKGFKSEREVDQIMDAFPSLEEFAELYGYALNDPKVERAYDDMISAELEYNSRQDFYKKLEREGFEKGVERGVEQVIAKLRELGADESLIEALREKE